MKIHIANALSVILLLSATNLNLRAQQNISGSFLSNGNVRTYLGALPDNPEFPLRLVILFCGPAEGAGQMVERHFNDYLGTNTMVVYPEPLYFMGAFGFEIGSEEDDFLMVEDLIDHIDDNFSIDLNDICIGGVSNGGTFCYDLVCEYNSTESNRPYQFKAFAVVAGVMDSTHVNLDYCNIANEVPLIAIHGTDDQHAFYEGNSYYYNGIDTFWYNNAHTEALIDFWARTINGCDENPSVTPLPDLVIEPQVPSTVELIKYECDNCSNTQLYKVINGLHTWPTSNAVNDNLYGGHNQDIVASQLIADFFECSNTLSTSNELLDSSSISVYPNPVGEMFYIETTHSIEHVEIINTTGQTVFSALNSSTTIELRDFTPGIYFLRIETDAGTTVKKIVKH